MTDLCASCKVSMARTFAGRAMWETGTSGPGASLRCSLSRTVQMKSKPVFPKSYAGRAIALLIVSIMGSSFGPFWAAADEAITLSQVLNAWRKREQRVKSFRFQWSEDHFQAKGSLVLPPDPQYKGVVFPPKDTTYRVESSCEMVQNAMRYSYSGESLQLYNDGALEHREYVSARTATLVKHSGRFPTNCATIPRE